MSAPQPTPGPWELRPAAMGGLSSLIFPRDFEYPVASITGYFNSAGQTLPNARLIAAAPELLEFAEEVRRTGDTRLASMAIAIIAKATGGAL